MRALFAARGPIGVVAAVLAGSVSACAFAIGLNHVGDLFFFLIYLAATPLFAAGLGAGVAATIVASVSGLATLLIAKLPGHASLFMIAFGLPIIGLIAVALTSKDEPSGTKIWASEGRILSSAVIYPSLLFIIFCGLSWQAPGGLEGMTAKYMHEGAAQFKAQVPPDLSAQFDSMVSTITLFLPAIFGTTWIFLMLVSMVIAQNGLEQQKLQLRPALELRNLRLPDWSLYMVAISGLIGVFAPSPWNYIGTNLACLFGLPFVFSGLAIMHAWAATTRWPRALLIVLYIILSVMPMLGILVTLLGAIDQWVNFRKYFPKPTTTNIS